MAYTYGTAANPDELLEDLKDFLSLNGWTVNRWADIDHTYTTGTGISGLGKQLCVQKTNGYGQTMYFNLRSCNNCRPLEALNTTTSTEGGIRLGMVTGLAISGSQGYDGGLAWDKQSGYTSEDNLGVSSIGGVTTGMFTSVNYWFVLHDDCVSMVFEIATDYYLFSLFGQLILQGSAPNCGPFYNFAHMCQTPQTDYIENYNLGIGSNRPSSSSLSYGPSGAVFVTNVEGLTGWYALGYDRLASGSYTSAHIHYGELLGRGSYDTGPKYSDWVVQSAYLGPFWEGVPGQMSHITPMAPIHCIINRNSLTRQSILGHVPGIRYCNVSGLANEAEFTLGADTWKVFPSGSRSHYSSEIVELFGIHGIALLIS